MSMRTLASRLPRVTLGTETFIACVAVFLAAAANTAFWRGALAGRSFAELHTWVFVAACFVLLAGVQFLLIAAIGTRRTLKPLVTLFVVISLVADHYMRRYGIVLDPTMVSNVVHTDVREASELITVDTVLVVLAGVAASLLFWRAELRVLPFWKSVRRRAAAIIGAVVLLVAVLLLIFQDMSSLMRNHKSLRYTINPASTVWSLGSVAAADLWARSVTRDPPEPVERRAKASGGKPTLFVLVVGETARAANFSLNGYPRATTPELAKLDIINFPHATACGTSTEVSLPCMFSPFGRADYDEARIRRHESLLHVLSRAGYRVTWLDNQSGCKGVCEGLDARDLTRANVPGACADGRCFDEVLAHEFERVLEAGTGDAVFVLHQIGNHGPAYFRRYPQSMKRFTPACEKEELRDCTREEIVNAYDNAIAYTDVFLAAMVKRLDALRDRYDVALAYASDHGESLGEKGLYLHGVPYAFAPSEQTHVPMFWWLPKDSAAAFGVDEACFRAQAQRAVSHDNLYHTIMGMLGTSTPRYRPERDLTKACRLG